MEHGGDLSKAVAHYGGRFQDWLDLSTGINPQPWPVDGRILADALCRLPAHADEDALTAAAKLAYHVPDDAGIALAPGTQALIQWLPHLLAAGDIAMIAPTYSEHARSWKRAGRGVFEIKDPGDVCALPGGVRHALIVNPNNPDGRITENETLIALAKEMQRRGGVLILDEAFADIEPSMGCAKMCGTFPIIVLRSFGKFYGLPGLRLGFLIASHSIVLLIQAALGPWAVSTPALAIGTAALKDSLWAETARTKLSAMAQRLDDVLQQAGLEIAGGISLFRLMRHSHAKRLHDQLAGKRIWCRRFDDQDGLLRFGLPRDDKDLARLREALKLS